MSPEKHVSRLAISFMKDSFPNYIIEHTHVFGNRAKRHGYYLNPKIAKGLTIVLAKDNASQNVFATVAIMSPSETKPYNRYLGNLIAYQRLSSKKNWIKLDYSVYNNRIDRFDFQHLIAEVVNKVNTGMIKL